MVLVAQEFCKAISSSESSLEELCGGQTIAWSCRSMFKALKGVLRYVEGIFHHAAWTAAV